MQHYALTILVHFGPLSVLRERNTWTEKLEFIVLIGCLETGGENLSNHHRTRPRNLVNWCTTCLRRRRCD